LYLRSLASTISFSKSLRMDVKIFLGLSPLFSTISANVSSLPAVLSMDIMSSSVLFSFTIAIIPTLVACF